MQRKALLTKHFCVVFRIVGKFNPVWTMKRLYSFNFTYQQGGVGNMLLETKILFLTPHVPNTTPVLFVLPFFQILSLVY